MVWGFGVLGFSVIFAGALGLGGCLGRQGFELISSTL